MLSQSPINSPARSSAARSAVDLAEAAIEGELLGGDAPVTDHSDTASVERRLDLGERSLVERRCQIEAGDLGGRVRRPATSFAFHWAMCMTLTALPITSAGRFWPLGPLGHMLRRAK
ncbi:MAG TPA: hypothetical protein VH519_13625 [Hyphomicrobiaceae bacterium]